MRIGIVGGGLKGMALARRLSGPGRQVDVYERDQQLGGLTTHHDYGGFFWDRFYHVILPSDKHLIGFVNDIGLGNELCWKRTRTGFFVDARMHSISNNMEFLKFPLLSLVDKLRLALTMIYSSRINDWQSLEGVTVEDWLRKVSGNRTYEKMWRPLLLAKLGENYQRVSAVFIWSYIKRLFSARDSAASKEQLGHVSGGYKQVFETLRQQINAAGGEVKTGVSVEGIHSVQDGGMQLRIAGQQSPIKYDKVVCTSPVPVLQRLADLDLLDVQDGSGEVEYLGVVCVVLVTRKPIVPYYVVNIADHTVPFTGIIGMSNVVDPKYTGGCYLTYLPKYVLSTDEWLSRSDADVTASFIDGLRQMLPDFDERSVERIFINRAVRVQPLQVKDFSRIVPNVETRHPDFYVQNTAQFLNATLNNNEVIRSVDEFVSRHAPDFASGAEIQ